MIGSTARKVLEHHKCYPSNELLVLTLFFAVENIKIMEGMTTEHGKLYLTGDNITITMRGNLGDCNHTCSKASSPLKD